MNDATDALGLYQLPKRHKRGEWTINNSKVSQL
jgi:hypothetical protein